MALLLAEGACSRSRSRVTELQIDAARSYWPNAGFVEMVPPIRVPLKPGTRVSVWLRLPERSQIRSEQRGPRLLLHYPEGTLAARVGEVASGVPRSWRVTDVRATRFEAGGSQLFQNFRPSPTQAGRLAGFEWRRDDPQGAAEALERIASLLRLGEAADSERSLARLRSTHECAACHVLARREARTVFELGEVHRASDGDGLFQVQTILDDRAPLEAYAPLEQNAEDPYVSFRCDDDPARISRKGKQPRVTCPGKRVPIGYLNVAQALRAGDERVGALCAARRYLFEHLDQLGRATYAPQFAECGI